jgi:hypothetical protein
MRAGLATPFSDVLDVEVLWRRGAVDGDGLLGLFHGDEKKWVVVCVVLVVVVTTSVVVVVSAIIKRESADSL